MRQLAIYKDIELSEQQMKNGQVKDVRTVIAEMRKNNKKF